MTSYRHATPKDRDSILDFVAEHWGRDHIVLHTPKLFRHLFIGLSGTPNVMLAIDSSAIVGMLGYSTSQFFGGGTDDNGIYLQMWKVKPDQNQPVGFMLQQALEEQIEGHFIACLGVDKSVLPLYDRLGFQTGVAKQWISQTGGVAPVDLSVAEGLAKAPLPYESVGKSATYLYRKFLSTNFYKYQAFHVLRGKQPILNLVGRVINDEKQGVRLFRVIDMTGDLEALQALCSALTHVADFVDLLFTIPEDEGYQLPGFSAATPDCYLPLYWEPTIREFRKKYWCFKPLVSLNNSFAIITGDSDQDRPNQ